MEENQAQAGKPGENGHEPENDSIVPDEILERIPQKERKEFIQTITKVAGVFSPQNPLIKKITPDHISKLLQMPTTATNETVKNERMKGITITRSWQLFYLLRCLYVRYSSGRLKLIC
jgi:hypothetical protein